MVEKYKGPIEEVKLVEKVVLTEKQAREFEAFKELRNSLEEWARDKYDPNAAGSVIHELTFDQVARAYLIGYEIEPEQPNFRAGDKVYVLIDNKIFTLDERKPEHDRSEFGNAWKVKDVLGWIGEKQFRNATQEEIYWLETLNRNSVKDFHIGDIYIDRECRAEVLEKERHLQLAQIWYADGDFKGLYPAESFKPFPKEQGNEPNQ